MQEPLIPDIEQQLAALWDKRADKNQIKASLFTLIIYTTDNQRGNYYHDIVQAILEHIPCRIIFIQSIPSLKEPTLRVFVDNQLIRQSELTVACDQILIEVSSHYLPRIPFLVLPHFIPDLPVYLIWAQDLQRDSFVFKPLLRSLKRMIVDPESSLELSSFFKEMQLSLQNYSKDLTDYVWALTSGWRGVIKSIFDTQKSFETLKNVERLRLCYNIKPSDYATHFDVQAIYLQGWIAAELNWVYEKNERIQGNQILTYTFQNQTIIVSLCPQLTSDFPAGAILDLEIVTSDGFCYFLSRKNNPSRVQVDFSSPLKCDLPFNLPLPDLKKSPFLMQSIFYESSQVGYEKMLKILAQITG